MVSCYLIRKISWINGYSFCVEPGIAPDDNSMPDLARKYTIEARLGIWKVAV